MMRVLSAVALALCAGLPAGNVHAQARGPVNGYPTKPIRMVLPFPAGGGLDILVRLLTPRLSESLGQPVIIDNRPAADGMVAEETVARATPDGYTLLSASSSHSINPAIRAKMPYDTLRDFTAITQIASQALLIVVSPALPVKSVQDLVAHAKKSPGALNFGSSSSAVHLPMELFNSMAGIKMTHVPYKGAGPMVSDILGGHIQLAFGASSSVMPLVRSGKLRALATGDSKRSHLLPDVPTVAESGIPGFRAVIWSGMMAPARTPRAIIERMNREVAEALKHPAVRDRMTNQLGLDPVGSSPAEFSKFIRDEVVTWGRIAKAAGIRAAN